MSRQPIEVQWVKSSSGQFLDLLRVNLNSSYFNVPRFGVYIIWHTGASSAPVITVGQGNIRERLGALRVSSHINQYSSSGQLKVSWILINQQDFDGVEAFLYDYYKPLVGERKQVSELIPVNPLLSL